MKLTENQARVVQLAANAELRTPEQMLSLLLAEGLNFYFFDREDMRGGAKMDYEAATDLMIKEAIYQISTTPTV
jgi:hypothetical protein